MTLLTPKRIPDSKDIELYVYSNSTYVAKPQIFVECTPQTRILGPYLAKQKQKRRTVPGLKLSEGCEARTLLFAGLCAWPNRKSLPARPKMEILFIGISCFLGYSFRFGLLLAFIMAYSGILIRALLKRLSKALLMPFYGLPGKGGDLRFVFVFLFLLFRFGLPPAI